MSSEVKDIRKSVIYGYCRVSGLSQDLEEQIEKIEREGVPKENIFSEKITGTVKNREQLNRLLEIVEKKDIIYITKLDRLSRDLKNALEIIEELNEKGVIIEILNIGRLDNSSTGKLLTQIMLAFAEFERNTIVERLQEGKEYQRKHNPGFKEGRPNKLNEVDVKSMVKLKETSKLTNKEIARMYNISLRSYYNYLKKLKKNI